MNGAAGIGFGVLFVAVFALAVSLSRLTLVRRPVMRLVAAVATALLAAAGAVLLIAKAPWQADAIAVVFAAVPVLVSLQTAAHLKMRRALRRRTGAAPASIGTGIRATLPAAGGSPPASATAVGPPPAMSTEEIDLVELGPIDRPPTRKVTGIEGVMLVVKVVKALFFTRREAPAYRALFLWVFDEGPGDQLLGSIRAMGPAYLLRGGGMLAGHRSLSILFGDAEAHIERSEAEIDARFTEFERVVAKGIYPLHSMLCSDEVWKYALDGMLARCDLVVVDLREFTAQRAGVLYEIGELFDRAPMDRVLFLVSGKVDRTAVLEAMRQRWAQMASDSPNRTDPAPVRLALADHIDDSKPDTEDLPPTFTPGERARAGLQRTLAESIGRPDLFNRPPPGFDFGSVER